MPRRPLVLASRPLLRRLAAFGLLALVTSGGAAGVPGGNPIVDKATRIAQALADRAVAWYQRTAPTDRITTGGLAACGLLGSLTFLERLARIRRRKVVPADFLRRYEERLREGKLDRGKALDLCELNPSPAAKIALVAIKRWGRPVTDLERAVSMSIRVESDRLRRNVGTLRRLAALSPLLGLLGTLLASSRNLAAPEAAWGPALAASLAPLTAGVAMAILFLVAYDGLMGRVEAIVATLDRLGAETVDAIAMAAPPEPRPSLAPEPRTSEPRSNEHHHPRETRTSAGPSYDAPRGHHQEPRRHPAPPRTPHQQIRVDIPDAMLRAIEHEDDLYDV